MLNKEQIRKAHNVAIKKATDNTYIIVRYANGFNKEPITLLKNVKQAELEKRMKRVLEIIAEASSTYTVFIKPVNKKDITQIAIALEDSGLTSSDVHIQKDGKIVFWAEGEDKQEVRNCIEDLLMDLGLTDVGEMVSIADKVPLPGQKNEELKELTKGAPKEENTLPPDTLTDGITRLPQEPVPTINKEQALYENLKATGELKTASEKAIFSRLEAKYAPKSASKSIEDEALSIIKESVSNTSLKIETDADLFTELQKRGFSLNDILKYFSRS